MANRINALAALVAVLACFKLAASHGGHFHGPAIPSDSGTPLAVIRRSSTFWTLPLLAHKGYKPNVTAIPNAKLAGRTLVQFYLYKNCTSKQSASVQLEVNLTKSDSPSGPRVPVDNYNLTGGVFTMNCQGLLTPGNTLFQLQKTDNPGSNYIWFEEATTNITGTIRGHGANDGKPTWVSKMRSVVIFEYNTANNVTLAEDPAWYIKNSKALFCANLGAQNPKWAKELDGKGSDC
uniref:Uncharacterized protein n=1 Tax=Tetradesmus obliquus TaxID=3088 RepID=A0A383W6I8_TETOB|eukprot:jgi/Sobl393_1/4466/SZX72634.1